MTLAVRRPSRRRRPHANAAKITGNGRRLFEFGRRCVTVGAILLLLLGDAVAAALVGSMVVLVCLVTYGSIYWRRRRAERL